jgi:hypothetical protein
VAAFSDDALHSRVPAGVERGTGAEVDAAGWDGVTEREDDGGAEVSGAALPALLLAAAEPVSGDVLGAQAASKSASAAAAVVHISPLFIR